MKKVMMATLLSIALMSLLTAGEAMAGTATAQAHTPLISLARDSNPGNLTMSATAGTQPLGSFTVGVNCSNGANWTLSANGGLNPSGYYSRNAVHNGSQLSYNLYSDSGYSQLISQNGTVTTGTGGGTNQTVTVYVCVYANIGGLPLGAYSDTLTFTVTF